MAAKIEEKTKKKFASRSRMKQGLGESINPNTAGARRAFARMFHVIIYANIDMLTERWSLSQEIHFSLLCRIAIRFAWNCFCRNFPSSIPTDKILLVCDGASWHKAHALEIPANIHFAFIPPGTPEMNLLEQIWKEIHKLGFRNEVFPSLAAVVDRLSSTIRNLSPLTFRHITARKWIASCFN